MKQPSSPTSRLVRRGKLKAGTTYVPIAPNGKSMVGTYERVPGTALAGTVTIAGNSAIEPDYEGTTEMDWDGQSALRKNGQRLWVDEDGRLWREDDLRFREETA